jgi:hypothetical protein
VGGGGGFGDNTHSVGLSAARLQTAAKTGAAGNAISQLTKRTIEIWAQLTALPIASAQTISSVSGNSTLEVSHSAYLNRLSGVMYLTLDWRTEESALARVRWNVNGIALNEWNHFGVSLDLTGITTVANQVAFALNGVDQGAPIIVADQVGSTPEAGDGTWYLNTGGRIAGSTVVSDIRLDEHRYWNVIKSTAELAASKSTQIDPASSGLVAYHRYNNDSWVDQTSGGYDLTAVTGTASASTDTPF